MKRQFQSNLKNVLFFGFLITVSFQESYASHTAGMEMFYRHKLDSTYEFTLIFYRNCSLTGWPASSLSIVSSAISVGMGNSSFNLALLPTSGFGIPALQPANMFNCLNASSICVEEYVYRGDWTSPKRATDWKFSFQLCCRPNTGAPVNVVNGMMYVECGLNNFDFSDNKAKNWSPLWHNRRPNHPGYSNDTVVNYQYKYLLEGGYYTLDQSVREYQGDSVSYGFYWVQSGNGSLASYKNGHCFSGCPQGPLPTLNGPLTINPVTGSIQIVPGAPQMSGVYIIGIEAAEYRKDTIISGSNLVIVPKKIGYVRRELTINILDSNYYRKDSSHIKGYHLTSQPENNILKINFHNGIVGDPNSLVKCNTISPDGSEFRVVDSSNYVAPYDSTVLNIGILSASWKCRGGLTDEINLELVEKLKCATYHVVLKTGTDLDVIQSECGYWEPEFSSGKITTDSIDPVNIGPDTTVCSNKAFSMNLDAGPNYPNYYWNTWDTTRKITVSYARKYWVRVENDFGCFSTDTMEIFKKYCQDTTVIDTTGNDTTHVGMINNQEFEFSVFPNPANDILHVKIKESDENIQLILRNMNGQILSQTVISASQQEIDVSNYKPGMYFLELYNKDGLRKILKIVIE